MATPQHIPQLIVAQSYPFREFKGTEELIYDIHHLLPQPAPYPALGLGEVLEALFRQAPEQLVHGHAPRMLYAPLRLALKAPCSLAVHFRLQIILKVTVYLVAELVIVPIAHQLAQSLVAHDLMEHGLGNVARVSMIGKHDHHLAGPGVIPCFPAAHILRELPGVSHHLHRSAELVCHLLHALTLRLHSVLPVRPARRVGPGFPVSQRTAAILVAGFKNPLVYSAPCVVALDANNVQQLDATPSDGFYFISQCPEVAVVACNVEVAVENGRFSSDLYYALADISGCLPGVGSNAGKWGMYITHNAACARQDKERHFPPVSHAMRVQKARNIHGTANQRLAHWVIVRSKDLLVECMYFQRIFLRRYALHSFAGYSIAVERAILAGLEIDDDAVYRHVAHLLEQFEHADILRRAFQIAARMIVHEVNLVGLDAAVCQRCCRHIYHGRREGSHAEFHYGRGTVLDKDCKRMFFGGILERREYIGYVIGALNPLSACEVE